MQPLQIGFVNVFVALHITTGDLRALRLRMKLDYVVSLSILLAILFIGTVGAFLLYVPALTVFTVATLLFGLALMFALGLLTGRRQRKLSLFASNRTAPVKRLPGNFYVVR